MNNSIQNKQRINAIDYLRGFSISTIVIMHLLEPHVHGVISKAISFGGAGVHVFILISGFGLYLSHLNNPLDYISFLKKRFTKVYEPYAIVVFIWGLWYWLIKGCFPIDECCSHWFLYKMFSPYYDVCLCYPFWFISTIIQLYIFWPLIRIFAQIGNAKSFGTISKYNVFGAIILSMLWSTIVGIRGFEEMRPWGSCFFQYMWEFVLGMWLADSYFFHKKESSFFERHKLIWVISGTILGISMTGIMGWKGGVLKLYNDIPSLLGYLCLAILTYRLCAYFKPLAIINRFFIWISTFGYELYLVHYLVFTIMAYICSPILANSLVLVLGMASAVICAIAFHNVLLKLN